MPRKPRKTPPGVSFANGLLESIAEASGAGWFRDDQQQQLRTLVLNEFGDLTDAGLLHDSVHLDQLEHESELQNFPLGGRPGKEDSVAEDNSPLDISVEEVVISEISGPDDDDPICRECSTTSTVRTGSPMIISCDD